MSTDNIADSSNTEYIKEYKNIGETTSEFSNRLKSKLGCSKIGICGKLDPMAKGVTIVLTDDNTKLMNKYLKHNKLYEFYISFGIKTDTDDIMGKILDVNDNISNDYVKLIKNYLLTTYTGITTQKFHHFSAIKVKKNGINRKIFNWYLEGKLEDSMIPSKKVTVYNIKYLDTEIVKYSDYLQDVISKIDLVNDKETFRVDDIKRSWENISFNSDIIKMKFSILVSSGFYIRMIADNIYKSFNIPVHIYGIDRKDVI